MLTLPDFKEKQILFINTIEYEGETKIKFANDNIVFLKDDRIINRASCHKVFSVFIIGEITITSGIIKNGLKFGISFFFLTSNFQVYAEIGAKGEANFLVRMRQYSLSEKDEFDIAKLIVANKIKNEFYILGKIKDFKMKEDKILKTKDVDTLRGIEGNASKEFFKEYFKDIEWYRREPRTKVDINNLLLDIGYIILFNFTDSILRLYGFDTYKGVYHKLFFARKSLSTDLMEPLRCVINKTILKMHNLNQINKDDFILKNGKFILSWQHSFKYSKIFSQAIMDRKEDIYNYIQSYYRHIMNPKDNHYKEFTIYKKY